MDETLSWSQKYKSSEKFEYIKQDVQSFYNGLTRCFKIINDTHMNIPVSPEIKIVIEQNLNPTTKRLTNDFVEFYQTLKEEMVEDLKYFKSLENEIEFLQSQLELQQTQFSNEIDRLLREYYYVDHMNALLGVYNNLDEYSEMTCDYLETVVKCERLENELSKQTKNVENKSYNELSKKFAKLEKHCISLELSLQHRNKSFQNDKPCKNQDAPGFPEFFEINELKAQVQDKNIAISELKKLIAKMKEKSVDTKFAKPSITRQPNAFKFQKPSVLGKPAPFSYSLEKKDFVKSRSVTRNNVTHDLIKPVTPHILPKNVNQVQKNTNVITPGMYKMNTRPTETRTPELPHDIRKTNKRVSFFTRVIPTTSVSRPRLKSTQLEDRVMQNNSQVETKEVEDH
ncbi:hypothetical protein Tco_0561863 [Tanacetum coccineum]